MWIVGTAVALSVQPARAQAQPGPGECPQPRFTGKAPDEYYGLKNPLEATPENIAAAERLYVGTPRTIQCAICHGNRGDGKGALAQMYDPPPRNFACAQTVNGIPDGQLFWIVKFGSPGTAMPGSSRLSDEAIWQLVLVLLAGSPNDRERTAPDPRILQLMRFSRWAMQQRRRR